MKKIILFFVFTLISSSLFAKEKFGIDIGAGVKAGLNFNKVVANEWKENYNTDPLAGFFVYVNKYRIGVQLEAIWTQNQMTTDSSFYGLYHQYYNKGVDSFNNGTFRFTTISIPFLLNIKLAQFLWLQGGPQYSANVGVIDKDKIIQSGVSIIEKSNFNVVGGLWLQFGSKSALFHINAGLRYVSGINSMSNISTITGTKSEWQNQMIQLHIGISY